AQQNFVVTEPSLADNPIVFASDGFFKLTGYTSKEVIGRNCRLLQGPDTDRKSVATLRQAIANGEDVSVCLLNYRADGTTFWNQFFVAALRDDQHRIVNYVGAQCVVPYPPPPAPPRDSAAGAAAAAESTRGEVGGSSGSGGSRSGGGGGGGSSNGPGVGSSSVGGRSSGGDGGGGKNSGSSNRGSRVGLTGVKGYPVR
ncbi:unnamed protein product, partial [Ectocarpus sp. 12 AP-2014]